MIDKPAPVDDLSASVPIAPSPALHPLQKWGARAAIGSFAIASIILVVTLVNFSRTSSPEEKRRDELLKELSSDYFGSGVGPITVNAQAYRDAAAPYINRRLREMNENWEFDPKTNHTIPYR